MKRIILFLIRRRLHIGLYEAFRFSNQKSSRDFYSIGNTAIWKWDSSIGKLIPSNVSLNWILNDECEIIKL